MPVTALTWTVVGRGDGRHPTAFRLLLEGSGHLLGEPRRPSGFWVAALVGAFLTAVYMGRGTFLAFFGRPRFEGHPHDPPAPMRLVLLALGALAVIGGVLGLSAEQRRSSSGSSAR